MTVIMKAVNTHLALKKVGFFTLNRFINLSDYDHVDWATVPLDTNWDIKNGKLEQLQAWVRSHSDSDDYECHRKIYMSRKHPLRERLNLSRKEIPKNLNLKGLK